MDEVPSRKPQTWVCPLCGRTLPASCETCPIDGVDLGEVLDRGAFDLSRAIENDPHFLDDHDHHDHDHDDDHDHDHDHGHDHDHHGHASPIHDVSVQSVSLRGGEMDSRKFFPWIEKVTQLEGPNILRLKGIIAFSDDPERYEWTDASGARVTVDVSKGRCTAWQLHRDDTSAA